MASPRPDMGCSRPGPDVFEMSRNVPVAQVVVEEAALAEGGSEMGAVDFGIDVSVDKEEVGPAVVVDVSEDGSPTEGVGVDAQT